jgi:hypothetical protein
MIISKRTIRTKSRQNYNLKLNVPDVLISWSYILASIACTISASCVTFIFTRKQEKYSDKKNPHTKLSMVASRSVCSPVVLLMVCTRVKRDVRPIVTPCHGLNT